MCVPENNPRQFRARGKDLSVLVLGGNSPARSSFLPCPTCPRPAATSIFTHSIIPWAIYFPWSILHSDSISQRGIWQHLSLISILIKFPAQKMVALPRVAAGRMPGWKTSWISCFFFFKHVSHWCSKSSFVDMYISPWYCLLCIETSSSCDSANQQWSWRREMRLRRDHTPSWCCC